jgi:uncharacterized caspase-like protein
MIPRRDLAAWLSGLGMLLGAAVDVSAQPVTATSAIAGNPPSEIGLRHALVIGNAAYRNAVPLANPVNDSQALCATLRALRFQTACLQDIPDRRRLRDAIHAFTQRLKPDDVALIYFAGHGIEVDGENFLIPTEADLPSRSYVQDEALRLGFVFDELREARVRLSILILDACRNNPFTKMRSSVGTGLSAPAALPAGSILIFPTAPGQVAYDGTGRNGLFTSHLLKHISTPGITIEEMFKRVIDGVRTESSRYRMEQVPWMNLSFTGEFCFVGCGTRVSTEQYLALMREKQQVETITAELQARLAARQDEIEAFRQQMQAMEARLSQQQEDTTLSRSDREALAAEREELTGKTARLAQQQVEITRLHDELGRLQREQGEYQRREQDMRVSKDRIAQLEQQLSLQEDRKITLQAAQLASLRQERDELLTQQQRNENLQAQLQETRQKLERLQAALAEVDLQKRELDEYRVRIARLESEGRHKDAALMAMRTDLETREKELAGVRKRLSTLQDQLQTTAQDSRVSQSSLAKLREERDGLVESSRLLADRDRELRLVRERLVRLESMRPQQQSDPAAQREVQALRTRLQEYDQQQVQLNAYKKRLAEAEVLLNDAAAAAVKRAAFVAPAL